MKTKLAGMGGAPSQTFVDDVFSTYLYTGNGSTQTITNGIDLAGKGGLVWIKDRTADASIQSHYLMDTNRGTSAGYVSSNSTNAANPYPLVNSFNSNGFGFNPPVSDAGYSFSSWTFRKAAKFFDVVTYTGDGSSHHSIPHSLGSVPGMIIVKRTDTASNWAVYHNELGIGTLYLNTTAAYFVDTTIWDGTPSATTFSVSTNSIVNASGGTYVAYLFAHDTSSTGIIHCGYATAGTNVNLGWEPQYVMMRNPSALANWLIVDSMRGMPVGSAAKGLMANASDAESDWGGYVVPNATGFTIGTDGIYMAIRMPNKPPTTGTQVYNAIARTGTGAAATVTGVGFPPDLVITGHRTNPTYGFGKVAVDRMRGAKTKIYVDANSSEGVTTDSFLSFNMDGFSLGADTSEGNSNENSANLINWNFKRAPGFFDEVCYSTTIQGTQAINHNLGVAPELMIIKKRSSSGTSWIVYSAYLGAGSTAYLWLNQNYQAGWFGSGTYWANTSPTATQFTVGGDGAVTGYSETFVAYLFATLAGIQYINSYVGDGTTGRVINCGFSAGARFICIKATSTTGSWWVWDSARGITSTNDPALQLNSTAAEITSADAIDPSSSGFIVNQEATCSINASGVSYLVWAIA